MTISAKVIAHSVNPQGKEIITMVLKYPRFIHSEFMTHRVFSRNASSSRAIPFKKSLKNIKDCMAMPIHWGANQSGMQANKEVLGLRRALAKVLWKITGRMVCFMASIMNLLGIHKQVVNRMIEPWSHISVVVTTTELSNFFALRNHKDAQPEIKQLARAIIEAKDNSEPRRLEYGEWHLPFVSEDEIFSLYEKLGMESTYNEFWLPLIKRSVARCARVSYLTHEGKSPNPEKDEELHDKLVGSNPIHASPAEHQALSAASPWREQTKNFKDWIQYRYYVENIGSTPDKHMWLIKDIPKSKDIWYWRITT